MNFFHLTSGILNKFDKQQLLGISDTINIVKSVFRSKADQLSTQKHNEQLFSDCVTENYNFDYYIFKPGNDLKFDNAILMLHGLNERNWSKYMSWAATLCERTNRPVILFPLAYHMNRSPENWSSPRLIIEAYNDRRKAFDNHRSISLANTALSNRLHEQPDRFYNSGKQSLIDIFSLLKQIKSGKHNSFNANAQIDVFAYSIGAFIAEIAFMSDTEKLLQKSRLFLFCGGGLFSSMHGESRLIMDKFSFERIQKYYNAEFKKNYSSNENSFMAFMSMINNSTAKRKRLNFFKKNAARIKGISLKKDIVMPFEGIEEALGKDIAMQNIELIDFTYDYTHEQPFPINKETANDDVIKSFDFVFSKAAEFLKAG